MDGKLLAKANALQKEIRQLDLFIGTASRIWTGKLIIGCYGSEKYEMDTETKNKMQSVLRYHLEELRQSFNNL